MAGWPYNSARWRKLRWLKLQSSPLCEQCEDIGITKLANTVDHRTPISEGGAPFPPLEELASLCPPCHSAKTVRGPEAGAFRTSKPRKGCRPDGTPLDRSHAWHADKRANDAPVSAALPALERQKIAPVCAVEDRRPHKKIVS